jgi:hypothetical protein
MAYFSIQNFKYGLDTRRSELTSNPGTLQTLENAHINEGGVPEKRKAFVPVGNLPAGTFGLEVTSNGLMVFGSESTPAGLPPGVAYQQLVAPSGAAMTGVVYSCSFSGNPFVVAQYADGNTFVFYNGNQVTDFTAGTSSFDFTSNNSIAAGLVALINLTGLYTAVQHASPNQNEFDVTALPGADYTPTITDTTAAGVLSAQRIHGPIAPIGASSSTGQFQIVAGSTAFASGSLTGTVPNDGDTVVLGATTYTAKTTLGVTNGQVLIGGNIANFLANLVAAITFTGTEGTQYIGVAANASATAALSTLVSNTVLFTALSPNVNSVNLSASSGGRLTVSGAHLLGGLPNYVTSITANATQLINVGTYPNGIPFSANNSSSQFAADIVVAINAYTSTSGFTAIASQNTVQIASVSQTSNNNGGLIVVTSSGNVCIGNCSFQLVGSAFTLNDITIGGSNLLASPSSLVYPTAGATPTLFNNAVVNNINAATVGSGYLAYTDDIIIYLSKAVTSSSDPPITVTVDITPTTGGTGGTSGAGSNLLAVATPTTIGVTNGGTGLGINNTTGRRWRLISSFSVNVTGGIPPYKYQWLTPLATPVPSNTEIAYVTSQSSATVNTTNAQSSGPLWLYIVVQTGKPALVVQCVCQVTDFNNNVTFSNPVTINIPAS